MDDCVEYLEDFFIHGESSKALEKINRKKLQSVIQRYGREFCRVLNCLYQNDGKKFRLSDIVQLQESSMIATVFRFDDKNTDIGFHEDFSRIGIGGLTKNIISGQLTISRIVKLYPEEDVIVFIKPNQYRYWLSITAYRDADKYLSELAKNGY